MTAPEPEDVDEMRSLASSLLQSLDRELQQMELGQRPDGIKLLYDGVYLPRLITLSEKATRCAESEDWRLLCLPLQPDFAATQIQMVVEMLRLLQMAL